MNLHSNTGGSQGKRNPSEAKRFDWIDFIQIFILLVANFISPGVLTAFNLVVILMIFVFKKSNIKLLDEKFLLLVFPFFIIAIVGSIAGNDNDRYIFWKDMWYVLNPVVLIFLGYALYAFRPDVGSILRSFVIAGVLISGYQIALVLQNPQLLWLDAVDIRSEVGTGYYISALALIVLIMYRKHWSVLLKLPNNTAVFYLVICSAAILLSFSRTMLLVVAIGVLASGGFFSKREAVRVLGVVMIGIFIIGALRVVVDVDSDEATKTMIGKIARIPDEIFAQEYSDFRDININWRGFESDRALYYFNSGNFLDQVFGYGFGAEVSLGLAINLGDGADGERYAVEYVPILHNGFLYVLIKGGVVSLFFVIFFLIRLYFLGRNTARLTRDISIVNRAQLIQTSALVLVLTTWFIAGIFNKQDMVPFFVLIGSLIHSMTHQNRAS